MTLQLNASRPESGTPQALQWLPRLTFFLAAVDDIPVDATGAVVSVRLEPEAQIVSVQSLFGTPGASMDLPPPYEALDGSDAGYEDDVSTVMGDQPATGKDDIDLVSELESLSLLEAQAQLLNQQIAARKKGLVFQMQRQRQSQCLKDLLEDCDSLVCKAKTIAQRICDKVGIPVRPDYGYTAMKKQYIQAVVSSADEKEAPCAKIPSGSGKVAEPQTLQIMLTSNGTSHGSNALDAVDIRNPLLQALAAISAVLGLSALFSFIRRRCMSMRKRVERAADLEERRNARAYRQAARRAAMRKRWDSVVGALNCFGSAKKEEPRIQDYDEKRALILQDAFLEQDLDVAEKGEVMEAEIRELRNAHEIVSGLVRVRGVGDRYAYATTTMARHDPPPCLVPLPSGRSRASTRASLHTLPSYFSESLPDYTSHVSPSLLSGGRGSSRTSSISEGYALDSTTDGQERRTATSVTSDTAVSRASRYTPTSSVRVMSPRPSEETLRTMLTRSTRSRRSTDC